MEVYFIKLPPPMENYSFLFFKFCDVKLWWCLSCMLNHVNIFIKVCTSLSWLAKYIFTVVSIVKISSTILFV